MKRIVMPISLALAFLALPVATLAADPPMGDHAAAAPTMATMACRPATPKDTAASADAMTKAHVMMATMGTEKIVCMKLNHEAMMAEAAKAGKMSTAADANKAWLDFLNSAMIIPAGGTGGG
jgi:hypothetical protein